MGSPTGNSASRVGEKGKILVVDDANQVRDIICETLDAAGYLSVPASDGLEALERLNQERFDLILLDIWMPRMNGLEFLAVLRNRLNAPKAVVMTADSTPETLLRALREQAYEYINKPFKPAELVDLIQDALSAPGRGDHIEVLSARREWVELIVPCTIEAAERLQTFMMGLKADLAQDLRDGVGKAFRELLLNAIEWGGQLDPSRKVRIAYLRTKRMLLYRIADPGPGFRFEDLEHAAVGHAPGYPSEHLVVREQKGLRPGGFGLLMARAMVDELVYNEAQNEVVLVKYLDDAGKAQVTDQ